MKLSNAIQLAGTIKSLSPVAVPHNTQSDGGGVVINLEWVERGYLRQKWWDSAVAKSADQRRVARGMVKLARQNPGVIHLRVTIHSLPI